jgi:hypothetical protein
MGQLASNRGASTAGFGRWATPSFFAADAGPMPPRDTKNTAIAVARTTQRTIQIVVRENAIVTP